MANFWGSVLGLQAHRQDNGDGYLLGPSPRHTIWINRVPEEPSVKQRVHIDVRGISLTSVVALGATVAHDERAERPDWVTWTVMRDPERGEFCLFSGAAEPLRRLQSVVFDCVDHVAQSAWWADVLGGDATNHDGHFSSVETIVDAPFERLSFVPVPEPKLLKNRIHLDLFSSDVAELQRAGATLIRERDDEVRWDVLTDPEGNEFCIFAPD